MNDILDMIDDLKFMLYLRVKGSRGSGGWGHDGRLGKHGGSKAGSGGLKRIDVKPGSDIGERRELARILTEKKRKKRREAKRQSLLSAQEARSKLETLETLGKDIIRGEMKALKSEREELFDYVDRLERRLSLKKEGSAEYSNATNAIKEAYSKIGDMENKAVDLWTDNVLKKQRELLYAKGGSSDLKVYFSGDFDKERIDIYKKGIDEFSKMVGKGTALDDIEVVVFTSSEGSYAEYATINMAKSAGMRTVIHEMAHVLENVSKDEYTTDVNNVHKQAVDFLGKRTKGERSQRLRDLTNNPNYGKNDVAKPDKFVDPYTGKIYPHGATEIMSMGLEQMWKSPGRFAREDPEFFDFIYNTLENARTYQSSTK